jgi:hypothetical protein
MPEVNFGKRLELKISIDTFLIPLCALTHRQTLEQKSFISPASCINSHLTLRQTFFSSSALCIDSIWLYKEIMLTIIKALKSLKPITEESTKAGISSDHEKCLRDKTPFIRFTLSIPKVEKDATHRSIIALNIPCKPNVLNRLNAHSKCQ